MAKQKKKLIKNSQLPIEQYEHKDKKRLNNPPVGLVDARTDNGGLKKTKYEYDPHLDPQLSFDHSHAELHQSAIEKFQQLKERINGLEKCIAEFENTLNKEEFKKVKTALNKEQQALKEELKTLEATHLPGLVWAGKAEHTSFEVPTVSLHVHERIDPRRIIETVQKEDNSPRQISLFEEHKKPLREAIEFYKHKEDWSNRLIAGDSLLVMNSLLEKEGMGGKVQMMYFDPPYGIKYGSNFQPFVNKRDVKDGKDEDLTAEPEMIKAFRDTWELGIHSYLTYLRDRLLLARELLHESGSIFVQISDENVHLVRNLMDEVFGGKNFISLISFTTTSGFPSNALSRAGDYIVWYAKDKERMKYYQLFGEKTLGGERASQYKFVELPDGTIRALGEEEIENKESIPTKAKIIGADNLYSDGATESGSFKFMTIGLTQHKQKRSCCPC